MPLARGMAARWRSLRAAIGRRVCARSLGACTGEQFQKGYILPPGALEQIPIGASQDQVLIVMGTPSTVATLDGEVFLLHLAALRAQGRLHEPEGRSTSA